MAVKKISISLDSEVFEQAKHAADVEGIALSAWLSRAASEAADLAAAQAALAEYIEVYGEPDPDATAQARAELDAIGFWKPETAEERAARLEALARLRGEVPSQTRRRAG
ncbi:MAG: hypothetical protein ACRDST_06795 [Pseudonocardiaceae bacterium]